MEFFKNQLLIKLYEVSLSRERRCIELHSKDQPVLIVKIDEILNLNYFRPKQFIGSNKYWLNLKTKENGTLFFSTQFSDESFIKDFVELVPHDQLEKIDLSPEI